LAYRVVVTYALARSFRFYWHLVSPHITGRNTSRFQNLRHRLMRPVL
jgi:hypothetical protein